jgi:hypothetical protein
MVMSKASAVNSAKPPWQSSVQLRKTKKTHWSAVPSSVLLPEDNLTRGCVDHPDLALALRTQAFGSHGHCQGTVMDVNFFGDTGSPLSARQSAVTFNPEVSLPHTCGCCVHCCVSSRLSLPGYLVPGLFFVFSPLKAGLLLQLPVYTEPAELLCRYGHGFKAHSKKPIAVDGLFT